MISLVWGSYSMTEWLSVTPHYPISQHQFCMKPHTASCISVEHRKGIPTLPRSLGVQLSIFRMPKQWLHHTHGGAVCIAWLGRAESWLYIWVPTIVTPRNISLLGRRVYLLQLAAPESSISNIPKLSNPKLPDRGQYSSKIERKDRGANWVLRDWGIGVFPKRIHKFTGKMFISNDRVKLNAQAIGLSTT